MHRAKPVRFIAFGAPQLVVRGRAVQISRRQPVALLSVLALSDCPVSRDELSFLLWSDVPQDRARQRLRRSLSQLRRAVGALAESVFQLEGQTLQLNDTLCEVDAREFLRLSQQATSQPIPSAIQAAERAAQLCVGPLLQGLELHSAPEFEHWLSAQRERFAHIQRDVLLRLIDSYTQIGDFARALQAAERALRLDPLAEALHRRAMWLMDRLGKRADAVRSYVVFASFLERELGVVPDEQTRALYQALLEGKSAEQTYALAFGHPVHLVTTASQPSDVQASRAVRQLVLEAVAVCAEQVLRRVLSATSANALPLVIYVQGAGGAGKSRLLKMVIEGLREQRPEVSVWAHCAAQSVCSSAPFSLMTRLLREALNDQLARAASQVSFSSRLPLANLLEAQRLLPELRVAFPRLPPLERTALSDLPSIAERSAHLARARLIASAASALQALAAGRPVLVAIDDADQADPDSLEVLVRALTTHQAPPIVLLLAGRARSPGLERLLAATQQRQLLWLVPLPSLPHEATLRALTSAGIPSEQADKLLECSAGVPLAVIEMLRARSSDAEPCSLDQAIAHNLATLDPLGRRIIESIAILGVSSLTQIQQMTGQEVDVIEERVDQLMAWDWLAASKGEYFIAHPEIQRVVLSKASAVRKQRLHQQAARLLTHAQGEPAQIASHLEQAGQLEEAARAWLRAAHHAAEILAPDFALQAIQRGMQLTHSPEVQFELLCLQEAILHARGARAEQAATLDALCALVDKPNAPPAWLAEVRYRLGRYALARNAWSEAVDALERAAACCLHSDVRALALLGRALAGAGQQAESQRRLSQALELARQRGDRAEQLQCWLNIAEVALQREQFDKAREALSYAVELSDKSSVLLPQLLLALGKLASAQNDFALALAYAQESSELFARRGILDGEAEARTLAARMLARLSRFDEAIQAYEHAHLSYAALMMPQGMAAARVNTAALVLRLGEFERGLSLAREAYDLFAEIQDGRGLCAAANNIGFALIYLGQVDQAERWLREAHQRAVELNLPAQQASALANLGAALLCSGRLGEARACMEQGLALREALGHVDISVDCAFLAVACLRLGDLECAEAYSARGVSVLEQIPQAENPQQVWFARAQVLRAQGRHEEASSALERAAALLQHLQRLLTPRQAATYQSAFPFNTAILRALQQDLWPDPPAIA
ncbi:MAG: tetratricopeptide repeat protein [Anaerolineae bacterium]|nr:tetratricopeptide repeat protein [Anaerolineae bacterium]